MQHKIEYIGIDHSQYFTGASATYTEWENVYVGVGSTPREAAEDACENAAQCGFDTARVGTKQFSNHVPRELRAAWKEAGDDGECELYCYALLWTR
jgi:hypothetical protein